MKWNRNYRGSRWVSSGDTREGEVVNTVGIKIDIMSEHRSSELPWLSRLVLSILFLTIVNNINCYKWENWNSYTFTSQWFINVYSKMFSYKKYQSIWKPPYSSVNAGPFSKACSRYLQQVRKALLGSPRIKFLNEI